MLSCTPAAVLVLMVASRDWSLFPIAAGEKNLKSPQNVNVEIVDHNFILKWNWDDEPNSNVTFSAYYQNPDKMSNWIQLIGCQNVTGTKCTSTLTSITIFEKIRVRIRTEKGHETSPWYNVSSFVPYQIAQIGPPEVQLEAEDRAIKIIISPPGTINSSMWVTDSFTYNLVIWKNSSSVEKINLTVYHRDTIYDLSPETTYCLKVQARLRKQKKIGSYSPVLCINTTAEHIPPRPKNVEVDAAYNKYVLKWDYPYENMNFQVQYLLGYYKRSPADYSNKWKTISDCKNIISRQCDLSKEIKEGIFYLRVRASNGTITSFWSERKLDTNIKTRIDPPSIEVKSSEDSLSVYIRENSGKSEKIPMSQDYPLIYEVTYWENASNIENKMIVKEKLCKVSDLQPLVLYCFKVKALLESDKNNKSSEFSNVVCSKITPGNQQKNLIIVVCSLFLMGLILVSFGLKYLLKLVKHMFYPSYKPPSNIAEWFSGQPLKNLLVISEEQTEGCIIEKTNILVLEETNQNGKNSDICSKQDNHDSGHCSNEDETSSNKMTEET